MSKTIPEDIIIRILCQLPVKDLLGYRTVSKPWKSLIDGPDFIKLHLSHSQKSHSNVRAIVRDRDLYWVDLGSPNSATKLVNPIEDHQGTTEVFGSCNGLVGLKNNRGDVAIFNPATRRYRKLTIPQSEREFPTMSRVFFNSVIGFGHDPAKDDYKVLRMTLLTTKDCGSFHSVFMLYSLKTSRWKRVKGVPSTDCFKRGQALVRNAMHWLVIRAMGPPEPPSAIAAFDIGAERFTEVSQPNYDGEGFDTKVVELRGCLCVVCHYKMRGCDVCERSVLWMMKEYGVRESWTKLISVEPAELGFFFIYVVPLAFSKSGDRVLFEKDGAGFIVYDLQRKRAEFVKISGVKEYTEVSVYAESLVGLDHGIVAKSSDGEKARHNEDEGKKVKRKQSAEKRDDFLSKGFKLKL